MIEIRPNLDDAVFLPLSAAPTDIVDDGAVEFVAGHAEPNTDKAEVEAEGEQERRAESAGPHHGRPYDGGELGVARSAERRSDDHVGGLERLQDDVTPQAEFAEADNFGVTCIEREQLFAKKGDDYRHDEPARATGDQALVESAVRLVEVVGADEVRDQDLVPAAEADAQDNGEQGEVRAEDARGHGDDPQVDDDGGQDDLENLEADGFDRRGETDADPVGEDDAGTLEVGAADLVVHLEAQDEEKDRGSDEPRKHGGEGNTLDAHLRQSEVAVQEDDVHRRVRDDGDDVAEQIPDGKAVGRDQRRERRLDRPEGETDRDDVQEVAGVPCRVTRESHPADEVVRKRDDDKRDGDPEEEAAEQDHGLRGARLPGAFGPDELGGDAGARLRKSLDGHEQGAQDGHEGPYARCGRFGGARQEPAVHHRLAGGDAEGDEKRPRQA